MDTSSRMAKRTPVVHSKLSKPRTVEDTFTTLRSGLLNLNGTARPVLLWLLTMLLWLPGLGNLPLRDWDEGRVATVARSTIARLNLGFTDTDRFLAWKWDEAYLNKPPGLHWLIGSSTHFFGEHEWAVRLMPCLIASLAVPLILLLRRQLGGHGAENKALLAALILMTLMPMARHGRLAMLDGSLVTSALLLWTGWLGSRSTPWHGLLAGLGATGILMLKPPALIGFVLITVIISFLDRHHSLWRRKAMAWFATGISPGIAWHALHISRRGNDALLMWGGQGLHRVAGVVGDSTGAFILPITEVLEGGWPWLLLLPLGVKLAWQQRLRCSGRWELGLLFGSAALVLPLRSQLPWYSHLLWPSIALVCAEGLDQIMTCGRPRWISRIWVLMGAILLIGNQLTSMSRTTIELPHIALICAGIGLFAGGLQLNQTSKKRRRRGLITLLVGWGVSLLALWHSQLWLWELNESWDPRPIASAIRELPSEAKVILTGPTRPSLGWYANREMLQETDKTTESHWAVSNKPMKRCQARNEAMGSDKEQQNWKLWYCDTSKGSDSEQPVIGNNATRQNGLLSQ